MGRNRGSTIMLLESTHTADAYAHGADGNLAKRIGEQHVALCLERIQARGAAHHVLWPSPSLRSLLQGVAKASEPLTPEEIGKYDHCMSLDVAQSPTERAAVVIEKLRQ